MVARPAALVIFAVGVGGTCVGGTLAERGPTSVGMILAFESVTMNSMRYRSGRRRSRSPGADISVRIWSWMLFLLGCAGSCAGRAGSVPTGAGNRGAQPGGDVTGASVIDVAAMYLDQPAQFAIVASTPSSTWPTTGDAQAPGVSTGDSDFQQMTWLSDAGVMVGAAFTPPTACPETLVTAAATARRRIVPSDYPTIQAAIDAADPGDVVFVEPGTYREHVRLRSRISLIGAGANVTTLDGEGRGVSLVDYTGARNVVLQGFTLTGVGKASGCPAPDDPFFCSGNWYAAAIFGDGSGNGDIARGNDSVQGGTGGSGGGGGGSTGGVGGSGGGGSAEVADGGSTSGPARPCTDTSILVTQNIVRGNSIGMMAFFHARAVVRNNLFVDNTHAFVANHLQDHALVLNNAFFRNQQMAVASQAAYLDVVGNIIESSQVGVSHEFVQTGRISCNGFALNGNDGERVPIDQGGNVSLGQAFIAPDEGDFRPTPALISAVGQCLPDVSELVASWSRAEPGAFGGVLGAWSTGSAGPSLASGGTTGSGGEAGWGGSLGSGGTVGSGGDPFATR